MFPFPPSINLLNPPTRQYRYSVLGQARDNDTSTHSLYSPEEGVTAVIRTITLCNTSSSAATVNLFLDSDGSTYDQTTALVYGMSVGPNSTVQLDGYYGLDDPDGNIAYQQGTANAITVTVWGAEAPSS